MSASRYDDARTGGLGAAADKPDPVASLRDSNKGRVSAAACEDANPEARPGKAGGKRSQRRQPSTAHIHQQTPLQDGSRRPVVWQALGRLFESRRWNAKNAAPAPVPTLAKSDGGTGAFHMGAFFGSHRSDARGLSNNSGANFAMKFAAWWCCGAWWVGKLTPALWERAQIRRQDGAAAAAGIVV